MIFRASVDLPLVPRRLRARRLRVACAATTAGLLLTLAAARAGAADQQKVAEQIEARNKAAIAAYSAGNLDKMKSGLAKAISLGEENGLGKNAALAKAYLLMGVFEIDGNEDRDAGLRDFVKALRISPDVQIPGGMSTSAVVSAFKQARADAAAEPPADEGGKGEVAEKEERALLEPPAASKKSAAADKRHVEAEERDREARAERERETETRAREKEAKEERDRQAKDLAKARESEWKERADKEKLQAEKDRLQKEKADRDKQLADAKARFQEMEKTRADRDKDLAATRDREQKEHADKEKLQGEKTEKERQLADAKARILQLEKDKADRDKQLAETKESEKREREAKDRAEHAYQWAQTREKDRKSKEDLERTEREKQAAGPDLPGHIPEPLYCALPDETPAGADLYVHCVTQAAFRPKVVAFYFRSSGTSVYNALTLEKSKKGWYTALIPGSRVTGKQLQYYVEARDNREDVAATNGKATSPNVLTLLPASASGERPPARRPR